MVRGTIYAALPHTGDDTMGRHTGESRFGDRMTQRKFFVFLLLALCSPLPAQQSQPGSAAPTDAQLKATTARGRMLAEYDVAAWHATDVVEALKPDRAAAVVYLARRTNGKWEVVFGRMSPQNDRFLIVYRASEGEVPEEFTAKKLDPPVEDRGFYFEAAKAIETASKDFGRPPRPYNRYVLPTEDGRLYVYFLPGQTNAGIYPLGGDVRYTITLDGGTIIEKRQMHSNIIEKKESPPSGQQLAGGYHTHGVNNAVEDSDVFHVLNRQPSIPEIVGTPDKHMYEIETDGTINRVK